ncbi:hypothetical protein ABT112_28175 [Streptomyces sp. NPDC002055]|uniref:hypothetical protein n=1 Tax=Streptomyces sp. NPDC002055 TaxID=3154534 RepID=UPI003326B57B
MQSGLRRIGSVVMVLAGVAVASWLVFGPPHDWEGSMRWVRWALAAMSLGIIRGGVHLFFPEKSEGHAREGEAAEPEPAGPGGSG